MEKLAGKKLILSLVGILKKAWMGLFSGLFHAFSVVRSWYVHRLGSAKSTWRGVHIYLFPFHYLTGTGIPAHPWVQGDSTRKGV